MNKALSVLLITIILFFSFSVVSFADNSIVDSGKCGETEKDNVNWVLYKTGELVISGKGNVDWYVSNNKHTKRQPWYNYFDKIWCVTVKEGITGIGANAFNVDCANVASIPLCRIDLPLSLTSIDTTTVFSSNYELSYPNNYHSKYCRYICYSGDVNKWNRVNILTTNYDYIIDTGWIIKSQSVESNYAFGVNWDMLFENEKPEPYCELICNKKNNMVEVGKDYSLSVNYYVGEYYSGQIKWSSADGINILKKIKDKQDKESEIVYSPIKAGNHKISASLISNEDEIVCEDSIIIQSKDKRIINNIYKFLNHIGFSQFYGILLTFFIYSNYFLLGILTNIINSAPIL